MLRRVGVAIVAGLVLSLAYEPVALPYVAPFALAAYALVVRGLRARAAFVPGLAFGVAFYFVHIEWMLASEGFGPWAALATAEALFYGVLGSVAAVLHRYRTWPAWLALAWVAMEVLRSGWPFSGMPWGRLGFMVVDTPVAPALAYVGLNGVSLLLALIGFLLARVLVGDGGRERVLAGAGVGAVVVASLAPAVAPFHLTAGRSITVAAVQGDVPGRGDDVVAHYREVTDNQVSATQQLADDVAAGRVARPDFVVWPENSTAIDPFLDVATNAEIGDAVAAVGVPVLVGAIVDAGPEHVLNQGIVWDPVTGAGDRYTKWHPVPYGEYIPYRKYLSHLSLRLDQVPRDMQAGTRTTPLTIAGVRVADAICFDIAYDDGLTAQIEAGAQLVTVQTSNASFIYTDQIDQQFAMTRARAIETGKYVVVASVNGISGVIAPDGSVLTTAAARTRAVLDEQVTLMDGVTPGLRVGALIGSASPWLTLAPVLWAASTRWRRRTRRPPRTRTDARTDEGVSDDGAGERARAGGHGHPDLQRVREHRVDRRSPARRPA